jgi:hypothetical protein
VLRYPVKTITGGWNRFVKKVEIQTYGDAEIFD